MTDRSGGPAYPGQQAMCPDGTWNQTWQPGMSARLKIVTALTAVVPRGDATFDEWMRRLFHEAELLIVEEERLVKEDAKPDADDTSIDPAEYGRLVEKFDDCRAALARAVERLGGRPTPPDGSTMPWHDFLIAELDGPCNSVAKPGAGGEGA